MKTTFASATALMLTLAATGCGTVRPPGELVAARTSFNAAQTGAAVKYNPADLHTASEAIEVAESSFREEGDTSEVRDLAYIADRRAQIAEVRARTVLASAEYEQTTRAVHDAESANAKATADQLAAARQELALQRQEMAHQKAELAAAREAQAAADKRAAQAAADLARFASVKQETRGMVITLSGAVLFTSGKADLLPTAELKLQEVADALIKQDPDANIIIEGHTDAQGDAKYNKGLSERRAQSVRDYLVSRGIAADRVKAKGFGSSRSIADNRSQEGRANNRRVEIVVSPRAGDAGGRSASVQNGIAHGAGAAELP